jgi:uncharacterized repeat protein (TIGR01451 family)
MKKLPITLAAVLIALLAGMSLFSAVRAFADEATTTDEGVTQAQTGTPPESQEAVSESASSTPEVSENHSEQSEAAPAEATSQNSDATSTPENTSGISATSTEAASGTATSTQSELLASTTPPGPDADVETILGTATTSTGFLLDHATSTATSTLDEASTTPSENGENSATSTDGTSTPQTIVTGGASAFLNILNILNTSFINSLGSILFSNLTDATGTIDLRAASLFSGMCGASACDGQENVLVNLLQNAMIANDIVVNASSGENAANGTSTIETGNAFAGLNLINLANTTFLNTNYLLAALNAFSGVNGDIVFPSLAGFQTQDGASTENLSATGAVQNDVSASADSGDNSLDGTGAILTGDANAFTNVYNDVNSVVGSQIAILFRIAGAWNGNIYGLPDSISMVKGDDGSFLIFSPHGGGGTNAAAVSGTTTASIDNRVRAAAVSGENAVENGSDALISTGDSEAGVNIVNVANQTVIGKNWILAIVNIFGDFTGNISFGMPDLWVGDRIDAPAFVRNGSELAYTLTVTNKGDADATNVHVVETPSAYAQFSTSTPAGALGGGIQWDLGTLAPGQSVEIRYTANVSGSSPGVAITNHTAVTETEPDNNAKDNEDSATVNAGVPGGGGGGIVIGGSSSGGSLGMGGSSSSLSLARAKLSVKREPENISIATDTPTAHEHLVVTNDSSAGASDVIVRDNLYSPSGLPVHTEEWHLGTVAAGEEVDIDYDFTFGNNAPIGTYPMTTRIASGNADPVIANNGAITLVKARPISPMIFIHPKASMPPGITRHPHITPEVMGTSTLKASFLGIEDGPRIPTRPQIPLGIGFAGACLCALFAALGLKSRVL